VIRNPSPRDQQWQCQSTLPCAGLNLWFCCLPALRAFLVIILDVGAVVRPGWRLRGRSHRHPERRGGFWHHRTEAKKCWFCPGKGSTAAVNPQSSVISPGLKVIDPRFGVGDDRSAGDIPSSPGCAPSRTHEHTPDGAVPSGMVSEPEVKKIPPGYMVAEVSSLSIRASERDLPGLIRCDQSCHIPKQSWGWALMASQRNHQGWQRVAKIFQKFWNAAPHGWGTRNFFVCAQQFSPESWEALLNLLLAWGANMDLPLTQRGPQPKLSAWVFLPQPREGDRIFHQAEVTFPSPGRGHTELTPRSEKFSPAQGG